MNRIKGRLLHRIDNEKWLGYKHYSFFIFDESINITTKVASFPVGMKTAILSRFRFTNRLLRLEPKCCGRLSDTRYVVCMFSKLWLLDINSESITSIADMRQGFTTLNFCACNEALYFGDYGVNNSHEEINIYRIDQSLNVSVVYTFAAGTIRHIHNIINDLENGLFWILTGDNEPNSGIYKSDYEFQNVSDYVKGNQNYRAVVAFPTKLGLLYATDSVEKENYLYLFENSGRLTQICSINGSCIYGTELKDYYVFSTTVESVEGGGFLGLFTYKLGGGIKSRDVHLIAVSKKDLSVRIIEKYRKDWLPIKLFQYGRMVFPGGQQDSNILWAYNIACRKIDGKSIKIEL